MFWGKRSVIGVFGTAAILSWGISCSADAASSVVLVIHEVPDTLMAPALTPAEAGATPPALIKPATAEELQLPVPAPRAPAFLASVPSPPPPTAVPQDSLPAPQAQRARAGGEANRRGPGQ